MAEAYPAAAPRITTVEAEELARALELTKIDTLSREQDNSTPSGGRAQLSKIGALTTPLMRLKLDAAECLLTEGKWLLHQTAMSAEEMEELKEQIYGPEAEVPAAPHEQVIVIDPDSSLESVGAAPEPRKKVVTFETQKEEPEMEPGEIMEISSEEEMGEVPAQDDKKKAGPPAHAMETKADPTVTDESSTESVEYGTSDRIVIFTAGQDSAWNTERDSSTDTDSQEQGLKQVISEVRAIKEIQEEGIKFEVKRWKQKNRGISLHLLHDGLLRNWTLKDTKCCLTEGGGAVKDWIRRLRAGNLRIRGHSVVVVFSEFRKVEIEGKLKNSIAALSRAIRSVRPSIRIFICDCIDVGHNRVLGKSLSAHNSMMERVMRGLISSHGLRKVWFLNLAPYFEPREDKYVGQQRLTRLGCLHFRANLFREAGLSSYHSI